MKQGRGAFSCTLCLFFHYFFRKEFAGYTGSEAHCICLTKSLLFSLAFDLFTSVNMGSACSWPSQREGEARVEGQRYWKNLCWNVEVEVGCERIGNARLARQVYLVGWLVSLSMKVLPKERIGGGMAKKCLIKSL